MPTSVPTNGGITLSPNMAAGGDDPLGDLINSLDNIKDLLPDYSNITGGAEKVTVDKTACNEAADAPCCNEDGVTDAGIVKSSFWKNITAGAMAAINTANAYRMAQLQQDLAKRYVSLAEDFRKYYNERYRPLEEALTKEALALPKYKRDREQFYAGQMLTTARATAAGMVNKAISCTGRYCTGQRAAILTDQLMKQAGIESTVAGLAHRYTDKEEITHNNLRWDKREQVLKIGRDIPTQASSYAQLSAGIFGNLGRQAGKAAEGLVGFLGYERGNTEYPQRRIPPQVSLSHYRPTELKEFEFKKPQTYTVPKPPEQVIRIMG